MAFFSKLNSISLSSVQKSLSLAPNITAPWSQVRDCDVLFMEAYRIAGGTVYSNKRVQQSDKKSGSEKFTSKNINEKN